MWPSEPTHHRSDLFHLMLALTLPRDVQRKSPPIFPKIQISKFQKYRDNFKKTSNLFNILLQEEVYGRTTKPLVENVLQGYNATVFAYGATGSGKTYTMVGQPNQPGCMARALNDLFEAVDKTEDVVFKVNSIILPLTYTAMQPLS